MQMNNSQLCLLAQSHPDTPAAFVLWLGNNISIWDAFEAEALKVVNLGQRHYSARTIIHFLRHHSVLAETSESQWKINDHHSPYLARLFAMVHPEHADLFEYRTVA